MAAWVAELPFYTLHIRVKNIERKKERKKEWKKERKNGRKKE